MNSEKESPPANKNRIKNPEWMGQEELFTFSNGTDAIQEFKKMMKNKEKSPEVENDFTLQLFSKDEVYKNLSVPENSLQKSRFAKFFGDSKDSSEATNNPNGLMPDLSREYNQNDQKIQTNQKNEIPFTEEQHQFHRVMAMLTRSSIRPPDFQQTIPSPMEYANSRPTSVPMNYSQNRPNIPNSPNMEYQNGMIPMQYPNNRPFMEYSATRPPVEYQTGKVPIPSVPNSTNYFNTPLSFNGDVASRESQMGIPSQMNYVSSSMNQNLWVKPEQSSVRIPVVPLNIQPKGNFENIPHLGHLLDRTSQALTPRGAMSEKKIENGIKPAGTYTPADPSNSLNAMIQSSIKAKKSLPNAEMILKKLSDGY